MTTLEYELPAANISNMSVTDLAKQLEEDRRHLNIRTGKGKGVALLDVQSKNSLTFNSLNSCAEYLTSIGIKTTSHTLKSRILSGKEYKGYFLKWDEQIFVHGKANSISVSNIETGEVSIYNSMRDAERSTSIWRGTLKKYADSNEPYKGLKIAYI